MTSGNEGGPKAGVLWQRRAWLAQALLLAAPCARAAPPVVPLALSDGLGVLRPVAAAWLAPVVGASYWQTLLMFLCGKGVAVVGEVARLLWIFGMRLVLY